MFGTYTYRESARLLAVANPPLKSPSPGLHWHSLEDATCMSSKASLKLLKPYVCKDGCSTMTSGSAMGIAVNVEPVQQRAVSIVLMSSGR